LRLTDATERHRQVRQITRAGAPRADATAETLEVTHAAQRCTQRRPQLDVLDQLLDGVETASDRRRIQERVEEPLPEPAGAHRRRRLVEHPDERAATLAGERLQQLEVPP